MLSTFLHSSWARVRVNLIFQIDLAGDKNLLLKQLPSQSVVRTSSYISRCLIFFQCMGEYRRENAKHLFA